MTYLQRCAVERLTNLENKKIHLSYLNDKLKLLKMKSTTLHAYNYDKVKVQTCINSTEGSLVDNISDIEETESDISCISFEINMMERILSTLPENEQLVLERFFVNHEKYAVSRLIDELGYEQSQIYKIRTAAIEHLTYRLFGCSK